MRYYFLSFCFFFSLSAMHYEPHGDTQLIRAARTGDVPRAIELINAGASLEASNNYWITPFLAAAEKGHRTMLLVLHAYGAEPFAYEWGGNNALHLAVRNGHAHIIPFLLNLGIDPREKNWNFRTPLELAFENTNLEVEAVFEAFGIYQGDELEVVTE